FAAPLVLPDRQARSVQLILSPSSTPEFAFQIFSAGPDLEEESAWTLHATGALAGAADAPAPGAAFSIAEIQLRCNEHHRAADFYQAIWERGIQLGSSFRWITDIGRRDGEALCRLARPPGVEPAGPPMAPGLIDSCFQAFSATWPGQATDSSAYV